MTKTTPPAPAPVKPETTAVVVAEDFHDDAGFGFENATAESFAVPFLSILQSGSPQCKRSEGAYIPGAQEGMLYNSVTNEIFDGDVGLDLIPCYYNRFFIEWQVREAGGGYRGEHPQDTPLRFETSRDEKGREILPNGNQLNDTRVHYCLLLVNGIPTPAVISLSSTQIKKSKTWMTAMQNRKLEGKAGLYTPPMFAQVWKVTTKAESNDKGSWFGWHFEPVRLLSGITDPLYIMAKEFGNTIRKGGVKADYSRVPGEDDIDAPF